MFIKTLNFIWIPKEDIPTEYEELLGHDEPTTTKLEALYDQAMYIKVLEERFSDNIYKREIVMFGGEDHVPRELAYIKIFPDNLPKKSIRREIIDKRKPFGRVLSDAKVKSSREDMLFFQVYKEESIARYLFVPGNIYYGRKYSIFLIAEEKKLVENQKLLAEVIEIYSSPEEVSRQIK